jgi:cardiolipin synthase A/B
MAYTVRKRSSHEDEGRLIPASRTLAGRVPQSRVVVLALFALLTSSSCASLPRLEDYAPVRAETAPRILGPTGPLSPTQSQAVMERLTGEVEPTAFLQRYTRLMDVISGSPWVTGNKATLLTDGPAAIEAMVAAIRRATNHINIETFSVDEDDTGRRLAELLLQKQAEGVQVKLLYDSVGSFPAPSAFFQRLRDGGIQVREFNPFNPFKVRGDEWRVTHRDHRRILIVDGAVAFTGSSNLSNLYTSNPSGGRSRERYGEQGQQAWRDTDVQIEGPAVAEFQKLFLETWAHANGPEATRRYFPPLRHEGDDVIQVLGSTPGRMNRLTYMMYLSAFTYAEHSIHLTTSYVVPDAQMLSALTHAAERGVDVKIILPGHSDSDVVFYAGRWHYTALLDAGVKLYERGTGSILHAKTAVIDRIWSTVGSTNLDYWSLLHNDELNAVILGRDFATQMEGVFEADLRESTPIRVDEWEQRPFRDRVKEWFTSLLGRWL